MKYCKPRLPCVKIDNYSLFIIHHSLFIVTLLQSLRVCRQTHLPLHKGGFSVFVLYVLNTTLYKAGCFAFIKIYCKPWLPCVKGAVNEVTEGLTLFTITI